ncbi:MAG TPA: lamin tail domain-containing protein, partial [Candidatus Acetothermia bacterium]|nr:lamin tail domain-containing protein [Candidatus Acetothermia bacterium]
MKTTLIVILLIGGVFAISLVGIARDVAISEIAWAGSAGDPTAEWIELYNTTDSAVNLSGWRLVSSDGAPDTALGGSIAPHGYLVLYRATAKNKKVEGRIYYSGALRDGGESLRLLDPAGNEVDSANRQGGAWPAGSAGNPPRTMERINENGTDNAGNWASARNLSNDGQFYGTPGARNSVSYTPPQATFSFAPNPAHPGEPVLFTANASLDARTKIAAYAWD